MPLKVTDWSLAQGERFKILMERLGFTNQRKFSKRINISHTAVNNIINGRADLGSNVLRNLTAVYPEANLNYLFTGIGEPLLTIVEVKYPDGHVEQQHLEEPTEVYVSDTEAENAFGYFRGLEARLRKLEGKSKGKKSKS